ncbi:NAD(P)/FAD-dependent oxidoreductase [Bailinhaonella thermotolerans]|uniref:FAD-dependent oxidoreductase n=1 Tax=Bailinhaonella thermotolerans TaxID=1070861 RepID=A0A3A4B1Z9_9ACTN|nr:FAD-dependent oxidoreductase [Bailinhaonella thermotolerans]RJL34198.1 FAD-dependent oxidoreductase [Bailinhaonella thermotolerans]
MSELRRIVVAGASLAGLRAVQTLREEGYTGEIRLVGAESHAPYNRPPLSKAMLRGDEDIALPGAGELGEEWLRGRQAVRLDAGGRVVALDDGTELPYDGLVIATGARPRHLPGRPAGVRTLRTVEDSLALRAALRSGAGRVVVVGGGFIGGEVATTARGLGLDVTLIDAGPYPMLDVIGEEAARWLAAHHERHGVELLSGVRVTGVEGAEEVRALRLDDGREIPASLVVAGLGVEPNTEWLEGSGLTLDDGVVTTPGLHAVGADGIVAAGDVARWPHELYGGALVRVEHWGNANEQGALAARNLLAGPAAATPYAAVPSFATHMHGARIQTAGLPHLADESRTVAGDPGEDSFAVAFLREGVPVGAVAVNAPRELIRLKRAIAAARPLEAAA